VKRNAVVLSSLVVAVAAGALWVGGTLWAGADDRNEQIWVSFNIDRAGSSYVTRLRNEVGHRLSIEADDELILLTTRGNLAAGTFTHKILSVPPRTDAMYVVRKAHDDLVDTLEGDVIAKAGRMAVLQARSPYLKQLTWHPAISKLTESIVLARQADNDTFKSPVTFSRYTAAVVEQVDSQRWYGELDRLAAMNRFSRGNGIQAAQKHIEDTLAALPGMEVSIQAFTMGSTTAYNVIGKLTGRSRPDDWIIVGAHYDSISQSTSTAAPGAEDNGSGAAGMLELAKIFAGFEPESTILFIGFSGEEQGLKGSYAHVAKVIADGNKEKIKAVLNMDMIGYTRDSDLDCLLESDQRGSALFPLLSAAAAEFTSLRIVTSLNPFGSDHVPYIEKGIPSLLVIENDWNEYPSYHKTSDTIQNITVAMGEQTLRMQAAVISELAGVNGRK
jgi:hypothetical protein